MTASELIARARDLCLRIKRTYPGELGAYACGWQREGFDLPWCWNAVRSALREGRAVSQVDAAVRSHYAGLQAAREARERALCRPVAAPSTLRQSTSQPYGQASAPPQNLFPEDDDFEGSDFWPSPQHDPEPRWKHQQARRREVGLQTQRGHSRASAPSEPGSQQAERRARRRRPDSRTVQFINFLRRRLGGGLLVPWSEIAAQARREELLRPDETVSGCKPLRIAKRALNVRSRRLAFGGPVHWQIAPPKWASLRSDGRQC
jgi:hypothetical protein